ncbi:monothiol glutaredoxin-S6-like [Mercurialis annua]|uniref:monothiol glutaredoxin-S6-like n=1 Tax=Mercurialis annua TaxID=3986 RepID=UPI00215F3400|nr:monothiol glutaredoxin-S6-like [Mercurialis annua]
MDAVTVMVAERPLVIFSRSTCDMSHSIKTLIHGFGANPTIYELDQLPNGQQIERALQQLGFQNLPVVFIGGECVGGDRQVMSLLLKNQLGPMLKKAGAIWVWND